MITLNNIVKALNNFADNHFMVNSFTHGNLDSLDIDKTPEYPIMHAIYTGSTYEDKQKDYSFEIYLVEAPIGADVDTDKEVYQLEAVSDMEQIAEDLITDIRAGFSVFTEGFDFDEEGVSISPVQHQNSNVLSGVALNITISVPYLNDYCSAPLIGVTPTEEDCECESGTYTNSDGSFTQVIAANSTFTSTDIDITEVDGATSTSPTNVDIVCNFPNLRLQNSLGTGLYNITSWPALSKYTMADLTFALNNSEGTFLENVTVPVGEDVTVSDVDFDILNEDGFVLGSVTAVVGDDVTVVDTTVTDSNSDTFSSGTATQISIPNINVTNVSTALGVMTITTPTAPTRSGIAYQNTHPACAISYVDDDSRDSFINGGYNRTHPAYPGSYAELDPAAEQSDVRGVPASGTLASTNIAPTILKENNAFGNKFRYTDDAGNQSNATVGTNIWAHVNWSAHTWTGATNFYVIDHLTGWGYTVRYALDGSKFNLNTTSDGQAWSDWIRYIKVATLGAYDTFLPIDFSEADNAHGAKSNPTEVWAADFFQFDNSVSGSARGGFLTGESYNSSNCYIIYDSSNSQILVDLTKSANSGFHSRLTNIFMKRIHYNA